MITIQICVLPHQGASNRAADVARARSGIPVLRGRCWTGRGDDGQARGPLGVNEIAHPGERTIKDRLVEEEQRRERLVLGRRTHAAGVSQARNERRDLPLGHLFWVALAVKQNEAPDPANVSLLGPRAVMPRAKRRSHAIEQRRRIGRRAGRMSGDRSRERPNTGGAVGESVGWAHARRRCESCAGCGRRSVVSSRLRARRRLPSSCRRSSGPGPSASWACSPP